MFNFTVVGILVHGKSQHQGDFAHAQSQKQVDQFEKRVKQWGGEPKLLTSQNVHEQQRQDRSYLRSVAFGHLVIDGLREATPHRGVPTTPYFGYVTTMSG